ncbi:MAG: cysteine rich repeat-containing protein [Nitrospira sp.]|nr:cysteine rich repeat-containing protein [Nitrospira sp.]
MKTSKPSDQSVKPITIVVTVGGLSLVWAIVWANLPSKEELMSSQSGASSVQTSRAPSLDLSIPGIPSRPMTNSVGTGQAAPVRTLGGLSVPLDSRARKIAEVKCDAEIQQYCPDSLAGEDRRRCVMQRLKRFDASCQQIVQQRLVRWKEAEGYKVACVVDVRRFCRTVPTADGGVLQCLQEHEQDLSEGCYQSLPKGRLQTRN